MKIPERDDDTAASFARQQDEIRIQVSSKMHERFVREVQALLDEEGS